MSEKLTREMIEHHEHWRLSMLVSATSLDVVLYTPMQEQALIYRRLPLDASAASPVTALQEAIYDNPLLLCEYQSVTILIDTDRFMLMPEEVAADDDVMRLAAGSLWKTPGSTLHRCGIPGRLTDRRIVMAVDSHLLTFLQRTYPLARIDHPFTPLITYFGTKAGVGTGSKMYVLLKGKTVNIMVFRRGMPVVVNTIGVTTTDETVYYILACARMAGMALDTDEIIIGGEAARRDIVSTRLRQFALYVMPVIFPAEIYRTGKEALQAPFELVILPLCV